MIKDRLQSGGQIGPLDFHPHYHWFRPPPSAEAIPFLTLKPDNDAVLLRLKDVLKYVLMLSSEELK